MSDTVQYTNYTVDDFLNQIPRDDTMEAAAADWRPVDPYIEHGERSINSAVVIDALGAALREARNRAATVEQQLRNERSAANAARRESNDFHRALCMAVERLNTANDALAAREDSDALLGEIVDVVKAVSKQQTNRDAAYAHIRMKLKDAGRL